MEKERLEERLEEMNLDYEKSLTVEKLQGLANVVETLAGATRERSTSDKVDYYMGQAAQQIAGAISKRVAYEEEKWRVDHDVAFPPPEKANVPDKKEAL